MKFFKSIGHFFAVAAQGIVKAARATQHAAVVAGHAAQQVEDAATAAQPLADRLAAGLSPEAQQVENAAFHVFGDVLDAIEAVGDAASANGVIVSLDKAAVEKAKVAAEHIKKFAKDAGLQKPGFSEPKPSQPAVIAN